MNQLPPHVYLGLDLGQRHDPAAIAILHRTVEPTGAFNHVTWEFEREVHFRLCHTERLALGTSYIQIVARIGRLLEKLSAPLPGSHCYAGTAPLRTLVVDASGVGRPVVELIRKSRIGWTPEPGNPPRVAIAPVTITASGSPHCEASGDEFVSRRDLITNLRILLERRLLKISGRIHDRQALLKELVELQDRSGSKHDDLVMATAIACWRATRRVNLT
ncbi:MAG: hypothetical protein P4K98_08805 [Bryobacteraceae bacterium]|nr:hypothetical protein [Bryobacteraceae bacterium]